MQIYRGAIELLDYVFYATVERGKVYETGAFIHNYALAYALNLVQGDTYTYAQQIQEPHYQEELTPLNDYLYITPGSPERIAHRLVQWNTLSEGYAFPGKLPSVGYPDWGFSQILRPGCRFVFYILFFRPDIPTKMSTLYDLVDGRAIRIRLGKFPGKARVKLELAEKVIDRTGPFHVDTFLNWRDLGIDPLACDVVPASLPTRLLARSDFGGGPYYETHFGDDSVCLPAQMRFLARPLTTRKRARKR